MRRPTKTVFIKYSGALVATALAVGLRLLLDPWLGDRLPFMTLFGGVAFAAWFGGRGPALLALVTGALAAIFFLLEPRYALIVYKFEYQLGIVLYSLLSCVFIALFESLRNARKQTEEKQQHLEEEIAARRLAEKSLADREELLRITLGSIGDAVITTDLTGAVTYLNHVAQSLTDWLFEDARGKPLVSVFHAINERDRESVINPATCALSEVAGVGLSQPMLLISKHGLERPIELGASPIRDNAGRLRGVVLIFRDVTERSRADQEIRNLNRDLHRRNTEFQTLLDVIPIGIAVADDPQCQRIWTNPAMSRWLALSPKANISLSAPAEKRPGYKVYQGDRELSADELPMQVAIATGQPVSGVRHDLQLPDGTRLSLLQYAVPLYDEQGGIRGGLYAGVDVTNQERTRNALQEAEQRWRTLAEALPNLVWTDLPDGQCDWLSSQWGKYTGIPENELLGLQWVEKVLHPDDRERTLACWMAACADEGDYDIEYRIRRYDGEYHWFKTRGVPMRNEQGKIVYWFGTCTDIEDNKRLEQALRLQVIKTNRLIESNIIGIVFADTERITGANDAFLTIVGYTRADLEAGELRWRQMTPSEHSPLDEQAWTELRQSGACMPFQKEYFRKNGSRVPVLIAAAVIDSTTWECVCFVQDMSRVKQVEQQLREDDRRKDEFLATLAHELRSPLAPIRNGLQVIRMANGNPDAVEQARNMMERQLTQMVRLVDDLMDVSRISSGKLELKKELVPLTAVLNSAIETSRPLIEQMGHQLSVQMGQAVVVEADLTRLAQVFLNLLNNSAKYSERGGHIWLTAERQGSDVVVSVKDEGIGIAADQLPSIFEMFSQVNRSLEKAQGGLGIGLTLVKRLVEMHGGRIEARSDGPGKGCEFVVRLPVVVESSIHQPGDAREDGDMKSSLRILVVDDNRDGTDSLAMMLKMMGNDTSTAYDGEEAVAAAIEFRPDVILLDIGLPKLTGYEACHRIRQQPGGNDYVIIAQTGWGQEEDRRRTHEAGFDHHMVKPVDPQTLMKLLIDIQAAKA